MSIRVLAILNPSSKDFAAKERWPKLDEALSSKASVRLLETVASEKRTKKAIIELVDEGYDRVIAIGGDGTVHLVVNALMERSPDGQGLPELGVIPFGTANDLAKSLNLPLSRYDELAEIAVGPALVGLDVAHAELSLDGEVRQTYWIDSLTVGMDADVLAAREKYRSLGGYLAYAGAIAERSIGQRSLDVRMRVDEEVIDARVFNAIINNIPVYAGELAMPNCRFDDGLLDVYYFNRTEYASKLLTFAIKQMDLLGLGMDELIEELTQNQQETHGRSVKMRLASPRRIQIDGESFGRADELTCSIRAQLRVAAPAAAE